jgi:predicted PurR-regulated permease PerM
MDRRHKHQQTARWFYILAAAGVIILSWQIAASYAIAIITAAIAAIMLAPLDRLLLKILRHRKLTALLLLVLTVVIVVIPLILLTVIMVNEATGIIQGTFGTGRTASSFNWLEHPWLMRLPENIREQIATFNLSTLGVNATKWIIANTAAIFSGTADLFVKTVFFFISLYYFLSDRERIHKTLVELSPFGDKLDEKIIDRLTFTIRSTVFGALIIGVVKGILAGLGMAMFGVPGAVLWGALTVIASQVPILGTAIILVPAVAYLFFTGDNFAALGLAVWAVLIVGLIDNLLSPYILEKRTKMHGLLILLFILGGLEVFGPIGFIIGPTILAALLVIVELYQSGILQNGEERMKKYIKE